MDGLTLEDWVRAIFGFHWGAAGVAPPQLSRGDYSVIVRGALLDHGLDALDPRASELVRAEGFTLNWARLPKRCGATQGNNIYVPRGLSHEMTRVLIHHERSHGWITRREDHEATEADAWFLTAFFAWPPWLMHRPPPALPGWFLTLCRNFHNNSYGMFLTNP